MPSCSLSAALIFCSGALSPAFGSSTASSSGALKPAPKPSLSRS